MPRKLTEEQRNISEEIFGRVFAKENVSIKMKDGREVSIVRMTGEQYITGYSEEEFVIEDFSEFEEFCDKIAPDVESFSGRNKFEAIMEGIDNEE